jgi:prevent-host-death family protein
MNTMIHIRPVSDLRNKFPEIEELVTKEGQPVFLTKNGYGSMVVLSLEKYAELTDDIELKLDEADREAESSDVRYTHDEVFSRVRSRINEKR